MFNIKEKGDKRNLGKKELREQNRDRQTKQLKVIGDGLKKKNKNRFKIGRGEIEKKREDDNKRKDNKDERMWKVQTQRETERKEGEKKKQKMSEKSSGCTDIIFTKYGYKKQRINF